MWSQYVLSHPCDTTLHITKCSLTWSVMLWCYFHVVLEFAWECFGLLTCCSLYFFLDGCNPKNYSSPYTVLHHHLPKSFQIVNKFKVFFVCSKFRERGRVNFMSAFWPGKWHSLSLVVVKQDKCDKHIVMPPCDRLPNIVIQILQRKLKLWNFSLFLP